MEEELDLRDILNMIGRRWKIILGVFLASALIAIIYSFSTPKVYEAKLMMKIGKINNQPLEKEETVVKIFDTKSVLKDVVLRLNSPVTEDKINAIKGKIYISKSADLLEIRAREKNSAKAVELVNVVSELILERHRLLFDEGQKVLKQCIANIEKQLFEIEGDVKNIRIKIKKDESTQSEAKAIILRGYIDSLEKKLEYQNILQTELREKQLKDAYSAEPSRIVVSVFAPEKPVLPNKKMNVLIAAFAGLIFGFLVASFVEYFEVPK